MGEYRTLRWTTSGSTKNERELDGTTGIYEKDQADVQFTVERPGLETGLGGQPASERAAVVSVGRNRDQGRSWGWGLELELEARALDY